LHQKKKFANKGAQRSRWRFRLPHQPLYWQAPTLHKKQDDHQNQDRVYSYEKNNSNKIQPVQTARIVQTTSPKLQSAGKIHNSLSSSLAFFSYMRFRLGGIASRTLLALGTTEKRQREDRSPLR